jgi:predicted MFS family arabinose efflux permease
VIGDITKREERGGYMGIYQAGLLAPLAFSPVLGGVFAQTLGWRAIFWFLTIYSGAFLIFLIIVLPETLRSMVGNGSTPPKGLSKSALSYIQRRRHLNSDSVVPETRPTSKTNLPVDFLGPLRMIVGLEVTYIIAFLAVYYTGWQMLITVMSTLFKQTYGLSEIQIGLTFIANGVGCIIGTLTTGKFLDYDYRQIKRNYTGSEEAFPLEHARLRTIWLWSGLQCAAVLVFGWTLDKGVHMSVPVICTFVLGWASTSIIGTVSTFMVDCFPKQGASATAALNLVRCLLAAGGTAAVLPIVNGIGVGWTFTLLVGIMLATLSLVWTQMRYGSKRRQRREEREKESTEQ